MTFIPDASSPKGFKYLLADVNAGYAFLETLSPSMSLPKYANDHGFSTVGSILNDGALRRLNEDIQLDYIEPTWEAMQTELGLTEEDIIRVPMLLKSLWLPRIYRHSHTQHAQYGCRYKRRRDWSRSGDARSILQKFHQQSVKRSVY